MVSLSQKAPDFSVLDQNGIRIQRADFEGSKNLVLYFYPKDDTPGCTIEANQFTALIDAYTALDTVVFGISKDTSQSHCDFIDKFDLKVGLLADVDGVMCEDYGVWQEKEKNGVTKMGIVRSTFIIDKAGIIRHAEYGVTPDGHAQAMLDLVERF